MTLHSALSDDALHVPGYISDTDPGAVGAGKMWIDTVGGTGAWVAKIRNDTDTGWEEVTGAGGGGAATQIDETGGPTTLDIAAIADGEYLKRSGTDIVGDTPAAGGSSYAPLKPATPDDDFDGASLDVAWTAHSSGGSFATTDCFTQARDGSSLRMEFFSKMGCLYRSQANTDLDIKATNIRGLGAMLGGSMMFGIAALNSSGTGVGLLVYNDNNVYLANITTWQYASLLQTFSERGHNRWGNSDYWLRLVRSGNNWTGYVSMNGKDWGTVSGTSAVTITVDRVAIGLFYDTGSTYIGAVECDSFDVT